MSERFEIVNGWLVENVNHHTCGAGTAESGYAHEPGCGQEPIAKVEQLLNRAAGVGICRNATSDATVLTSDDLHRVLSWHYDRAKFEYPDEDDYALARRLAGGAA
jgi:hypothetical protein